MLLLPLLLLPALSAAQDAQDVKPQPEAVSVARSVVQYSGQMALTDAQPQAEVKFKFPIADLMRDTMFSAAHGLLDVRFASYNHDGQLARVIEMDSDEVRLGTTVLGALEMRITQFGTDTPTDLRFKLTGPLIHIESSVRANIVVDMPGKAIRLEEGPIDGQLTVSLKDLLKLHPRFGWRATQGKVGLFAKIEGTTKNPKITGQLEAVDLQWNFHPVGNVKSKFTYEGGTTKIEASSRHNGITWVKVLGTIPAEVDVLKRLWAWKTSEPLDLQVTLANLTPRRLEPWIQPTRGVRYTLDGMLTAKGALSSLTVDSTLRGSVDSNGYNRPVDIELKSAKSKHDLTIKLDPDASLSLSTTLDPNVIYSGGEFDAAPVTGRIDADVPIFAVEPWLTTIGASQGRIVAAAEFSGTLGSPEVTGEVKTEEAQLTLIQLNRRLTNLVATAQFAGSTADITYSADSSPGKVSGKGTAKFGDSTELAVSVEFADMPIVRGDLPVSLATGAADITWQSGEEDTFSLTMRPTEIVVSDEKLPVINQLPTNANVRFQSEERSAANRARKKATWTIDASAGIQINGEDTAITVSEGFTVKTDGELVDVEKGLRASQGNFLLFDNPFVIRDGLVTLAPGNLKRNIPITKDGFKFAAPLEPVIELVAQGQVKDTLVMVKLNGPLRRPELVLMSFPPLPEYQIIALLVTGRVDSVSDRDGDVRRAAAKLVERYHNPSLERQLFDQIGVDKVGFGFGSSVANPILTVGKQVTRDLYIETIYRHDAPPDENMMEARVEQRLGDNWTVDTTFGEAAEGRAGVFWRTQWGAPAPKAPPAEKWSVKNPSHAREDKDGDGVPDPFDLCDHSVEDKDGFEDRDGCEDNDNDRDGIADKDDKAPMEPETYNGVEDTDGAPDEPPAQLQDFTGTARSYQFEKGRARLPRDAQEELRAFAEVTQNFNQMRVVVTGHSDQVGTERRNQAVSLQRARAMERELIQAGVDRRQIDVVGAGATQLIYEGEDEEKQNLNRRVEVELQFPKEEESE